MFTPVTEPSKQSSSGRDLDPVHLDDATLFSSSEEDVRLPVMAADSCIRNGTPSVLLHAQSFNNFAKKVLSAYHSFQDDLSKQNGMDGAEPVSFVKLLNFTLKNTAKLMSQCLTVMKQYVNIKGIFRCDAHDQKRPLKRKNEGRLERALEEVNRFSFPGPRTGRRLWSPLLPVLTAARVEGCT